MRIGVTGMFGSGKSTVSRIIARKLRCEHIDADKIAANVFRKKSARIRSVFGTTDRKEIARIVFSDAAMMKKLNQIVHPEILGILKWESRRHDVVLDVPLLLETDAYKFVNSIVLVKCYPSVRARRLKERGYSKQEARLRTMSQMPEHEKMLHADYVVNNSGTRADTQKQVVELCRKLTGRTL